MWYFAWILGTLLACAFGIITALALEHVESGKAGQEEKQTNNEDDIRDQRAEDTLPVYGTRTKANAVNDACADRPHQQKTMPDFKLTGFGRET